MGHRAHLPSGRAPTSCSTIVNDFGQNLMKGPHHDAGDEPAVRDDGDVAKGQAERGRGRQAREALVALLEPVGEGASKVGGG